MLAECHGGSEELPGISDNKAIISRIGFSAAMDHIEAEHQSKKRKAHREILLERHGLGRALHCNDVYGYSARWISTRQKLYSKQQKVVPVFRSKNGNAAKKCTKNGRIVSDFSVFVGSSEN